MIQKNITQEKANFIRYEIENGDDRRKKVALQEVARIYRSGARFPPDIRNSLELTINGLLSAQQDDKVTRWCLNCVAQMGTRDGSMQSVERALLQQVGNPEIIAAAVAAAAKLYAGQLDECTALGSVQPEIKTLAALQVTSPSKLDLSGFRINVDRADDEVLKLALIAVGLNRAFENMFHPRHSNGALVRVLGQHDNIIVKQYSVWSIIENEMLSINDLGIPLIDLESQPPNVQSKMLQLAAEQIVDPMERQDIIYKGSYLKSIDAREGLARGLQEVFYEGLEDITIDWFDVEASFRVRELLAEHFARFGSDSAVYKEKSIEILEKEPNLKNRLYLGAEGKKLYGELKRNDQRKGMGDLFGDDFDPVISNIAGTFKMKETKVLMMCASPKNTTFLRLDQEARDLREQMRLVDDKKREINITHAWAVRVDQVQMEVLNSSPNILHFSGHGSAGVLCFEDKDGEAKTVSSIAFEGLIKLSESIECVVMNACYSDSIADQLAPHVKAVIGCVSSIGDEAAVSFTSAFYRALAHDQSYQRAFDLALNDLQFRGMDAEAKKYRFVLGSRD
ncbi:CHAT domain-containing protein [Roseospira marina]|uniref:CHAT domain-containing protein n=1 Tax=Roseospira marina TaxID=140057 RepID=A0A5M6I6B6_9PROT|nr:CHAT domain-containing protein [Roseospira marina]KAA5603790.1 CHAT domain-containing protein [Roseospira marina]MBB4316082.1 hypothetical protein [Roseospira marina]MBB5089248.1 hypothetical protein [Roseospira marina]